MKILEGKHLYAFYEAVILPQFTDFDDEITWNGSQDTGPDETAHYFKHGKDEYALIFEDYDGHGRSDEYIREHVLEHHTTYEFINPCSETSRPPSYFLVLPTPYRYCPNVTGAFTLLRLIP